MLKFSDQHMKAFEAAQVHTLVERLVECLRDEHSLALGPIEDEPLRERVKWGLERACGYGLTREAALFGFVILQVEVAPHFDKHPAILAVLRDERIPADERVSALHLRIKDHEWVEAMKHKDLIAGTSAQGDADVA